MCSWHPIHALAVQLQQIPSSSGCFWDSSLKGCLLWRGLHGTENPDPGGCMMCIHQPCPHPVQGGSPLICRSASPLFLTSWIQILQRVSTWLGEGKVAAATPEITNCHLPHGRSLSVWIWGYIWTVLINMFNPLIPTSHMHSAVKTI